ncbi:hypothetical protein F511_02668 [Dorcoceras hygrometricum]|uniref:Uncharacterized protein n=1 Tax=Dorcoceras hygrometricum TaxID=472368 RepID=A0A2Z7D4T0_9LAMI|nr:hypothetical protein F511_02668 [Dorcoceras hygrometricum]
MRNITSTLLSSIFDAFASSLIANALQVNFDSVLNFLEEGMIPVADKGKVPLLAKHEIKGHPAREMFTLICTDIEFLVQIREKVIEEISSFFSSFSLHRLEILESVSDIAAKEEQILAWAETDSLQTDVARRLYIIVKYREILLRKFLEARHQNFESSTPTIAIDLQVLEMLSEAHHLALSTLMEQMSQHKLKWIRPSASNLFEGATVHRSAVISRSHTTIKSTCWIRQLIRFNGVWTFLEGSDKLHVQIRFHLDELKAALFKKTSSLETAFLTASGNQDRVVLAQTNVLCKEMQAQKDALSKEVDATRKEVHDQKAAITNDLLEFRVEAQENFQTLSTQLSEIIAYINRSRDDKKGEVSNSSRGPQPPDDQSADELALMMSSVTSSYSADGLREQSQESAGVLTAAGCGIGSVHEAVRSNLLVEPSEVEEGEM